MRSSHLLWINGQNSTSHTSYFKFRKSLFSFEVYLDVLDKIEPVFQALFIDEDVIVEYGLVWKKLIVLIFKVLYEFFGVVMFLLLAKDAFQDESIEHMFVSDMNIFFHLPGLTLTIGTPIIVIGDDLIV